MTRDRRKPHVIEADEQLVEALDEAEEAGGLEDDDAADELIFRDIGRDQEHFDALVQTARVLMDSGRPLQASELVAECITRLAKRSTHK